MYSNKQVGVSMLIVHQNMLAMMLPHPYHKLLVLDALIWGVRYAKDGARWGTEIECMSIRWCLINPD